MKTVSVPVQIIYELEDIIVPFALLESMEAVLDGIDDREFSEQDRYMQSLITVLEQYTAPGSADRIRMKGMQSEWLEYKYTFTNSVDD